MNTAVLILAIIGIIGGLFTLRHGGLAIGGCSAILLGLALHGAFIL